MGASTEEPLSCGVSARDIPKAVAGSFEVSLGPHCQIAAFIDEDRGELGSRRLARFLRHDDRRWPRLPIYVAQLRRGINAGLGTTRPDDTQASPDWRTSRKHHTDISP